MEHSPADGYAQQVDGRGPEPSPASKEPGVSDALSQIQHIIKDSTAGQQGTPSPRPQGSGYTFPRDPVSPPPEPATSRQHSYTTEPPATSLEDDMSEISISEPIAQTSNLSNARQSGLKPKLSGPRKSLQPPASPFAEDEEPLTNDGPASNTQQATFDVETPASSAQRHQEPSSEKRVVPSGRSITAPDGMNTAEDIDGSDRTAQAAGLDVQSRPFSPPPGTAAPVPTFNPQDNVPADFYEPPEFKGLLFYDGVDSIGRPVVVVDFDAVAPSTTRSAVMQYILQRLEPIVSQGPYVLVMLTTGKTGTSYLKGAWLIAAYRSLSRPFRKNVKYILLVKPSNGIRALLLLFKPFVSKKAHSKLKKVDTVANVAAVTNNEVQLQHLGPRFASAAGQYIADGIKTRPGSANVLTSLGECMNEPALPKSFEGQHLSYCRETNRYTPSEGHHTI
ncbi:hypothetical protein WJX74_000840 [Apatococcus lobatus]|uniref:CRAL-TRIO domain-containing protein n=1 Tax=Apatococcus lobatus TaxID=904363 RepID=A0AAW1Q5U9_9CHLO